MKKLSLLTLLLVLCAIIVATAPGYNFVVDEEVSAYRGHYKLDNGKPYVIDADGKHLLLLAPQEALDSLGIKLIDGDSLYVEAAKTKGGLLVTTMMQNEEFYSLRTNDLAYNYYDEQTTVKINPKGCIGCKLCVSQCPVGAISMENGKAVIDNDRCVSCGICVEGNGKFRGCPVRAITK